MTIADRLVGKVAGVQATTTADGEISFKIRGNGTLQSDAEPLIVVDGFPISTGFASINPNDVANISILKDAAAAQYDVQYGEYRISEEDFRHIFG